MIDPNLGITVAGRYEVIRLLGRGGYGAVYMAEPLQGDGPPVALKLLKPDVADQPQVLRRFEREARVLEMLDCRHTPRLQASGRLPDGGAFIAMDFIDGETVTHAIRRGPLSSVRVVRIARAVLDVLIRLHALDPPVYHRDLKPSNLMLCPGAEDEETVFVLDFGIAKVAYAAEQLQTVQTAQGMMPGSIAYSAPERFEGRDDPRSDLYSLGVIMFEALSGRNPFRHKSPAASMRAHLLLPVPEDLARRATEPALMDFVTRALAKSPDARFESAQAMLDALRLLPISAPSDGDDTDLTPLPAAQFAADLAEAARMRAEEAAALESASEPMAAESVALEPSVSEPIVSESRVSESSVSESRVSESSVSEPSVSEPVAPVAPVVSDLPESMPVSYASPSMGPAARPVVASEGWMTEQRVDGGVSIPAGISQARLPDAQGSNAAVKRLILALAAVVVAFIAFQVVKRVISKPAPPIASAARPKAATLSSQGPQSTASVAPDSYAFVTVVLDAGPARFVQVESEAVLCESARTCRVPIDIDTRVERDGFVPRVLSGDDLFDRRGHRWQILLRAK